MANPDKPEPSERELVETARNGLSPEAKAYFDELLRQSNPEDGTVSFLAKTIISMNESTLNTAMLMDTSKLEVTNDTFTITTPKQASGKTTESTSIPFAKIERGTAEHYDQKFGAPEQPARAHGTDNIVSAEEVKAFNKHFHTQFPLPDASIADILNKPVAFRNKEDAEGFGKGQTVAEYAKAQVADYLRKLSGTNKGHDNISEKGETYNIPVILKVDTTKIDDKTPRYNNGWIDMDEMEAGMKNVMLMSLPPKPPSGDKSR